MKAATSTIPDVGLRAAGNDTVRSEAVAAERNRRAAARLGEGLGKRFAALRHGKVKVGYLESERRVANRAADGMTGAALRPAGKQDGERVPQDAGTERSLGQAPDCVSRNRSSLEGDLRVAPARAKLSLESCGPKARQNKSFR